MASQIWFVKVHVAVGTCLVGGACVSTTAEHVYDQASFVDFLLQVQAAVKSVSRGRRLLVVLGKGHWVKYSEHWPKIRCFAEPVLLHDLPLQALFSRIQRKVGAGRTNYTSLSQFSDCVTNAAIETASRHD